MDLEEEEQDREDGDFIEYKRASWQTAESIHRWCTDIYDIVRVCLSQLRTNSLHIADF